MYSDIFLLPSDTMALAGVLTGGRFDDQKWRWSDTVFQEINFFKWFPGEHLLISHGYELAVNDKIPVT